MTVTPLPPDMAELVEFLSASGFEVIRDRSGGMGGRELWLQGEVLTGDRSVTTQVEVSGDRGHWVTSVRLPGMTSWITPAAWMELLDGLMVEQQTPEQGTLAYQVRYVQDRLPDMAARFLSDPDTEEKSNRLGREFMRKRYESGLDS